MAARDILKHAKSQSRQKGFCSNNWNSSCGWRAISYVLFGLATPEPAINTPAYNNQDAPPPAITTPEQVQAKQNDTIANQTQTA